MRESWHERFAESPDVLKSERCRQTVVPVLDLEIGGDEFITMAGPCSVETESQLLATAHHVRRAGARVLRGGAFKPRSSPYAFQGLGLEGLKLLARAREEYDLILIDTPAMMDLPDARILGNMSDGVVLVVRSGATDRRAAKDAMTRLQQDGIPVLGTVLNRWAV